MELEVNNQTILDYLTEDCWQAVLEYVPVNDIIHSERTSRHWQKVVLGYLSHVRICITHTCYPNLTDEFNIHNVHWIELDYDDWESFNTWTRKLGSSVVGIECNSKESLETVSEHCPNVEAVMFTELEEELLLSHENSNFTRLQYVEFLNCKISDQCAKHFISNNVLIELILRNTDQLTGECLLSIESKNLRSLVFLCCPNLESRHLVSALDRHSELTKLEFIDSANELYEVIQLLLDKLPNLEYLTLILTDYPRYKFRESVCRLRRLKHLHVWNSTTDADLEALSQHCKELRSLDLVYSYVTPRGLSALCRNAGARLTSLSLDGCNFTNNDIVACVRSCPKLTSLSVRDIDEVTPALVRRVAAARRKLRARVPLRLYVRGTNIFVDKMEFEEVIIDRNKRPEHMY